MQISLLQQWTSWTYLVSNTSPCYMPMFLYTVWEQVFLETATNTVIIEEIPYYTCKEWWRKWITLFHWYCFIIAESKKKKKFMVVGAAESLRQQMEPVSSLSLHVHSLRVSSSLKSNSHSWAITPMRKYAFLKYRTHKKLSQLCWHWAVYHSKNMRGLFKYGTVNRIQFKLSMMLWISP